MIRAVVWIAAACLLASPCVAKIVPFPAGFRAQEITLDGVTIHVRVGGEGPAVILLHGYGETGDMWGALATDLARDRRVIVPDLRGMGLSSRPEGGYDKKTEAEDIAGVLDALGVKQAELVTHDIGNMVGFAFAAKHPQRVTSFVIMDAPVPGVGPWEEILKNPLLWHFRFGGHDMERLVAGRERIYLDRFWNEFSANPARFDEASRRHYAKLYARQGAMRAGFMQFAAFDQDALDNKKLLESGRLKMPVLAVGGEKSFGPTMAHVMRFAADDVREATIADAGHWLMEEQPDATVALIRSFLDSVSVKQLVAERLNRTDIDVLAKGGPGAGTSGVAGIRTTTLIGDPSAAGPYVIEILVPANTRIAAHSHRDNRTATVVSGEWYFGYGDVADEAGAEALEAGGFYTEPAGQTHFAFTRDAPAAVYISGFGPTDTVYVEADDQPQ